MKGTNNTDLFYRIIVLFTLNFICLFSLQAQTIYTGPAGGDWFVSGNWSNGLPANGNNALIPGGASVVISGTPIVTNFNIDNFGSITLDGVTLTNGGSIYSGAVFNNNGEIINNQSFQNFGTLTCNGSFTNNGSFASGGPWTINAGATFTNNNTGNVNSTGAVTNNGSIENKGLFGQGNGFNHNGSFKNFPGATFNNNFGSNFNMAATASILNEGNVFNDGNIINAGSITNIGTFRNNVSLVNQNSIVNNAAAQIQNYGTLTNNASLVNHSGATLMNQFTIVNTGTINNSGSFENNNIFDNKSTGIYSNLTGSTYMNQFGSNLINAGSFTNNTSLNSNGAINNANIFVNNGTLNLNTGAVLSNTGQLTNNGSLANANTINNSGTLTNTQILNNVSGGIVNNFSVFNNQLGAVINNNYEFYNKSASSFNNAGIVNNDVRFSNEGALTNNGYLRSPGDLFNLASSSITNNEIIEIAEGNLKNQGNITNNKTLKITACASLRNSGTIQNNSLIQNKGLLFQYGTVTGNAIQTIGGYVHTNASSSVAPICQPVTVSANFDGEAKVYANSMINLGGSNNCNSLVYLANGVARPVWHCSDVGTIQTANVVVNTRIGDSLTCQSNVTVVDSLAPVFAGCPTPIYIQSVAANNAVSWTPPTATDNCTATTMTSTHTPGSVFQPGTTTITYTATDLNGRSNECQFTVNILQVPGTSNCNGDISGPTIINCPGNQTINTTGFSSTATWFPPTITDNCFPMAITSNYSPGSTFQLGTNPVVYTATDGNNNSSSCAFNITVNQQNIPCTSDLVKPVISNCPGNQFLTTNTSTNGSYATWSAPFASDNCGSVVLTANNASGNFFPVGATPVTYIATDQSNNTSSCYFVITVGAVSPCPGDVAGPVFSSCPANISLTTSGNSAVANWSAPTTSDACAPVIINNNYSSGTSFPLGVTLVQYTASDNIGNTSLCSFNVSVQNICDIDQTNPVITGCPSNIFVATTSNSAVATWTPPTATDNCILQSFSSNYLPGVAFPVGTTIVVYTATDIKGNVSNCNFSVTVANAPGCTSNTLPANNATEINPVSVALSWSPAVNATAYDVYLGTSSPPTTLVGTNVSTSTFTVTNLLGNTNYYWYIVPKNAAGNATGCASNATKFTTSSGACNVCAGNLLTNGCFNDGLNTYTVAGGTNIISTGAYAGTFAAELCGSAGSLVSNSPATPAYQYKWSVYAKISATGVCGNLIISFLNSSGVVISTAQTVAVTSTAYQLYNLTGVSPAGTASVRLTAAKCGAAGCLTIDEMCLTGDVYCDNITNGGTIAGTQPANCGPYDAPIINSSTLPTGGTGTIEYIWRSSTTSCPTATTGSIVLGANGATYDPPFITQTTYFIRLAKRSGCTNFIASNCVTYTVTTDNTVPVITNCPVSQNIGSSATCATATWITPTATDNCGTPFLTSNFNSGYCFPQGNTTVIYTATDAANNSKTCSFSITVGPAGDGFCKGTPGTGLSREVWNNISGSSVSNLTSNANYPNNPTSSSLNASSIGPVNIADNYGTRVRGYITPTTTGTYKFYVYGDDETQLFLSTNNQSANKVLIANVPGWTNVAELYKYTSQASANKTLTAGQNYYVELLQKEAGGGDHWGIYWIPPGSTTPVQIPLQYLAPISTACSPPACATLVSPANNATGIATASVPLTWNSSATATSYDIYLGTANPPTTIAASNITSTSYTATNLLAGTDYYWYVVPKNNNGSATGCNATIFKFTTVSPCSNLTSGGTIGKTCLNGQVSLTNVTLPTGGSGTLEYVWMKGTTSCDVATMTAVANSNSATLTVTSPSVTTYYIRCSRRSGCTEYTGESNCITVTANECNVTITCTGNLISNFGFESGFTGYWNYNNIATITTDAFQGTKAVKICADGGIGDSFNATPGKTYTFKAYAKKTEAPAYSDLFIQFFDSNWNLLSETYKPVTTSAYTEYTITSTAPAGTSYIQLMLWAGPGGCTYTDNWCLTESATACNTSVLFVVGNTTLGSGDLAVKNRLQSLGYSVTVKSDVASTTSDATGKGLVLISSTTNSTSVNTKFRNVTVPVMLYECYLFDDMKMTGTVDGTDLGVSSSVSQTKILLNHALTTGVTGTVSVFSGGTYVNWGKPGSAAIKAAVIPNSTTKHMLFAYDTGASMVGLTAPAKRIGFFLENTNAGSLTANGWKLFDNAVKWATGCNFGLALTAAESTVFEVSAYNELRKARIELVNNTGLTNDYFILERLNDNGAFEEIEYAEAGQTDNLTHMYSFYDEEPAEGSNYYRIRLIGIDGTEAISEVKKVVFGGLSKVVAYPNPARENIILDLTPFDGSEAIIYLYDLRGTEVMRIVKTDFENTSLEMDISHLADGIYTIRVHNSVRRDEIIPIVIQH
jgi:hypothetical protein